MNDAEDLRDQFENAVARILDDYDEALETGWQDRVADADYLYRALVREGWQVIPPSVNPTPRNNGN